MLRKYATADILGVEHAEQSGRIPDMWKAGHRVTFEYEPRPGFLYVRSRMISSRCNDNFDEFPGVEIRGDGQRTGYKTFIGKPAFVNHHNADHRRARGLIVQAALHEDHNPDGTEDIWAEGLHEVDALTYPKLARALIRGDIARTSMGVDVDYSLCSVCANKATNPAEYCGHIPGQKGIRRLRASHTGGRIQDITREICYGLRFFENSFLVEDPADPTAYVLGKVETGPGLDHLKTASQPGMKVSENMAYLAQPTREYSVAGARPDVCTVGAGASLIRPGDQLGATSVGSGTRLTQLGARQNSPKPFLLVAGRRCVACLSANTVADRMGNTECGDCGSAFHATAIAKDAAGPKYPNPSDHPWFQATPVHHDNIVDHWKQATKDEKSQGLRWYEDAHIIAKALGEHHEKLHGPHPHGAAHVGAGIVAAYSPQMGWAGNMHNAGRVLHDGKGIGGKGGGIFASDKQREQADRILGGERYEDVIKGPKVQDFAHLIEHGGDQNPQEPRAVIDRHALSVAAGRRMSNDDYSNFPQAQRHYYGHVVDQYHRAGMRITEQEGLHVAAHQVQATTWLVRQRLNQGEERARAEQGHDPRLDLGRERSRQKQEQGWQDWRQQHVPDIPHAGPGTGYVARRVGRRVTGGIGARAHLNSPADEEGARGRNVDRLGTEDSMIPPSGLHRTAYGETKAPPDVDTLRDENCPVCGETSAAWDGGECQVCGYVQPPKQFQDPDLDVAKQVDLRKDNADLGSTDVSDLENQTNDRDRDGLDDTTGLPVDEEEQGALDDQPLLVCPNCGIEVPAGEPQTLNTRDPEAGSSGMGPQEGDVCPNCGKAELMTGSELDEPEGEEPPEEGAEPSEEEERGVPQFGGGPQDEEEPPEDEEESSDGSTPVKKKKPPFKE